MAQSVGADTTGPLEPEQSGGGARPSEPELSLAQQAAAMIERDFPMLAGIDDLAEQLAVSKCHLIRCFTRERGLPPGQYLIQVRLSAVRAYLEREEYSVETIAGLTGFACGNYLSKVFRRAQGYTPTQYREQRQLDGSPATPGIHRSEDISYL